ncbi:MAG: ATP-binding protein [Acidobacteriota bacterium]
MIDPSGHALDRAAEPGPRREGVLTVETGGRILALDRRFLELWRLSPSSAPARLNALLEEILPEAADAERLRRCFAEPAPAEGDSAGGGEATALELRDGRNFEIVRRPARRGREIVGSIWSVRDTSHDARIEQRIRQAEKMAAIGRLVGGISHDFNNILTVIRGYCDIGMLRLKAPSPLPRGEIEESVSEISKAANRAAELTRQLLAYSRQQMISPRTLDLNLELRDLEKMLLRVVGSNVRLRLDLEAESPKVRVDPGQFHQLMLNLVINARDAMPGGGLVSIRTEAFTIDRAYAERFDYPVELGPVIMLTVRDTGMGIPRTLHGKIFEPFFTTKEVGRGTGLGLATVYGIAKQNGGYIWVDSEEGSGTVFRICLPRSFDEAEAPNQQLADALEAPAGEAILVVDDEPQVRKVVVHLLRDAGYRVRGVSSPEQALELQRQGESFDLLITDLIMPDLDGDSLAREMTRTQPGLVVLYTSGYHPDAFERRGVMASAGAVVPKPLSAGLLRRRVAEALRERHSRPPA